MILKRSDILSIGIFLGWTGGEARGRNERQEKKTCLYKGSLLGLRPRKEESQTGQGSKATQTMLKPKERGGKHST